MPCCDGAGVYRATARHFELAHESVSVTAGQYVRQQVFHVQHVNAYGWRRLIERCAGKFTPKIFLRHTVG